MTNEEFIALVRSFLGNITEEELPDGIITMFYNKWSLSFQLDKFPDRFSLVLYNTVLDCVRWLIVQEVSSGASSVTERFEKVGDETISVKGGSTWSSWKDFLAWLLENPEYIDPSLAFNASLVVIGGVRKDRFFAAKNNRNTVNGFMEQGVYPTPGIPRKSSWNCHDGRRSPWTR